MERAFERRLEAPFADFARAYLRKWPCARLGVLDAETVGAELRGAQLHLRRYKSLLGRARWAEERFALDRAAGAFALDERELGGAARERVSFAGGLYRKRATGECGAVRYALASEAGLARLRALLAKR